MSDKVKKLISGDSVRSVVLEDTELLEMADILGKRVRTDNIDFSFYVGPKDGNKHGIRAKICWNRDHFINGDGVLELHGFYEYFMEPNGEFVNAKQVNAARKFFKKYKLFIAALWEKCLDADDLREYFKGGITFDELIHSFYFDCSCFDGIQTIADVEKIIRERKLFNLND